MRSHIILDDLPGEIYPVEALHSIQNDCKYPSPLIKATQNQKYTENGGLTKSLQLKICAKFMLTSNIDIQDRLINDQVREFLHLVLQNNAIKKLYIKFLDPQSGLKAIANSPLSRQNSWVPTWNYNTNRNNF